MWNHKIQVHVLQTQRHVGPTASCEGRIVAIGKCADVPGFQRRTLQSENGRNLASWREWFWGFLPLTPLSSIALFCVVVDDDVIKLFVLMVDALDGWWLFGIVNGRWLSPFVALSVYVQCVRWACETHSITSYTDWLSSELLLLLLLFIWDASIISALMYAICSVGGVVVVVEHIWDETRSTDWPPPPLPFDGDK